MTAGEARLRDNVCVRPLVSRWHATEQLIPPIQAALNMKNVQFELLRSYLESPDHHWKAAHTPALVGGPWVDVSPARRAAVEHFMARLESEQKNKLRLAADVEALDRLLRDKAKGGSMARLYAETPESLRGFVELGYDASHQPVARYFESLLYRSHHYDPSQQSIGLHPIDRDARAAQFTTPVLDDDPMLRLDVPFADAAVDAVFASRKRPTCLGELCERLGFKGHERDRERFATLFTDEPARPAERANISGLRIRYFGHACILFETNDVSVLIDPVVSYRYPAQPPRFTFNDLPDPLDHIAITHFHKDHVNFETLLQLRGRTANVIVPKNSGGAIQDPSFRLALRAIGFRNVTDLDRLESVSLPGGEIIALPFLGEHADLDVQSKAAYLVQLGGWKVLCAADSANIEPALYRHLRNIVGDIDILFMGMECAGAPLSTTYGGIMLRSLPRAFDQERRTTGSDYEGAVGIVDELCPKQVYVYAMGLEPWLGHLLPIDSERDSLGITESDRLIAECRRRGLSADRPYCQLELNLPAKGKGH